MKFPWGLNQQKLKQMYMKEMSKSKDKKMNIMNDEQRRKNLGLDFLNTLNKKQVENIKKTFKVSVQKDNEDRNRKTGLTNKQLLQFKQQLYKKTNKQKENMQKNRKIIKLKKTQQEDDYDDDDFKQLYKEYKSIVNHKQTKKKQKKQYKSSLIGEGQIQTKQSGYGCNELDQKGQKNQNDGLEQEEYNDYDEIIQKIVKIQKLFRGFRTRKMLKQYFELVLNEYKLGESEKFNVILENENENHSENSILKNDYTVYRQLDSGEYYFNKENKNMMESNKNMMEFNRNTDEEKKVHISQIFESDSSQSHRYDKQQRQQQYNGLGSIIQKLERLMDTDKQDIQETLRMVINETKNIQKNMKKKKSQQSNRTEENGQKQIMNKNKDWRKKSLTINTKQVEQEYEERKLLNNNIRFKTEEEEDNNEESIKELRLVIGSEKLIKESQNNSCNSYLNQANNSMDNNSLVIEDKQMSIFGQMPFKKFTKEFIKSLKKPGKMNQLIQMRQEGLKLVHDNEIQIMKRKLEENRVSPKSFNIKKIQLEKWVTKEIEQLKKTKVQFEQGIATGLDNFYRTKRDDQLIKKLIGVSSNLSEAEEEYSPKYSQKRVISEPDIFYESRMSPINMKLNVIESKKIEKFPVQEKQKKVINNIDKKVESITDGLVNCLMEEYGNDLLMNYQLRQKTKQNFKQIGYYDKLVQKFDTNVVKIEDFLMHLCILVKSKYSKQFLNNINVPYDFDEKQKLKRLSGTKFQAQIDDCLIIPPQIVGDHVFDELQHYFTDDRKDINTRSISLLSSFELSLFKSMNEALEFFRPFDIRGKPLSWKVNQRKLTFSDINSDNIDIVLDQAKNKVLEWSLNICGFLNENQNESQQELMNLEIVDQIREERVERVIVNEIFETEEKWITYDDKETLIQLEISDLIFNDLVDELVQTLI